MKPSDLSFFDEWPDSLKERVSFFVIQQTENLPICVTVHYSDGTHETGYLHPQSKNELILPAIRRTEKSKNWKFLRPDIIRLTVRRMVMWDYIEDIVKKVMQT